MGFPVSAAKATISMIEDHKNREVFVGLQDAHKNINEALRLGLHDVGQENVRHLRKLIVDPPHTGRIYNQPGNLGSSHQASAPGEAPAEQTGRLRRSVDYRVTGHRFMEFGEYMFYGKFLELGTWRIEPRPHVERTVVERDIFNFKILDNAIKDAITR